MYGILARNRGMWGCESMCKDLDGNVLTFATKEEAQAKANEYNDRCGRINNFTQYFAVEYNQPTRTPGYVNVRR